MDIIDVVLGRSRMSAGQISQLTIAAQQALAAAQQAVTTAEDAAERADAIADDLESIIDDFTAAAQQYTDEQIAPINSTIADIQAAIEEMQENPQGSVVSLTPSSTADSNAITITVVNDGVESSYTFKNYINATGNNTDGSMTQAAIKTYIAQIKQELEQEIAQGGGSGCSCVFTEDDKGKVLIVGDDLRPYPSDTITEANLIATEIAANTYNGVNTIGMVADYNENTVQYVDSLNDHDTSKPLSERCEAFNLEQIYLDDNGNEVEYDANHDYPLMVRMNPFYYSRVILEQHTEPTSSLPIIDKEKLVLSTTPQAGFELHPAFRDSQGNPTPVYFSAYEGSATSGTNYVINDESFDATTQTLTSVANVLPISGASHQFLLPDAKAMAQRRGAGWDITNIEIESALQMLLITEFQSMNIQATWNLGPVQVATNSLTMNNALYTGSTAVLNGETGQAPSSHNRLNTFTTTGKCAISYHGIENPYGNLFRYVDNITSHNNNSTKSYQLYYKNTFIAQLSDVSNWTPGFGYSELVPWMFIPVKSSREASSAIPIGDWFYSPSFITTSGEFTTYCMMGGNYLSEKKAGPFSYGFDIYDNSDNTSKHSARLMFKKEA